MYIKHFNLNAFTAMLLSLICKKTIMHNIMTSLLVTQVKIVV